MKTIIKLAVIASVAVLMASCCACRRTPRKTQAPLADTEWQLIQLNGLAVKPEEGKFTLRLLSDGNRVTGVGVCNRLTGTFTTSEMRDLRFEVPAMTRMACVTGMQQEADFVRMLGGITDYAMDGKMLLLFSNGDVRAIFQAQPEK